jgi:hypothetical protein
VNYDGNCPTCLGVGRSLGELRWFVVFYGSTEKAPLYCTCVRSTVPVYALLYVCRGLLSKVVQGRYGFVRNCTELRSPVCTVIIIIMKHAHAGQLNSFTHLRALLGSMSAAF